MKTKLLALMLIFTLTGFSFAQESNENSRSNIKTPEELQQEVLKNKNSKNDEFEEFEYPEETEPIKFLIKADILFIEISQISKFAVLSYYFWTCGFCINWI